MMSHHYKFTRVGVLHHGYNFRIDLPLEYLKQGIRADCLPASVQYNFVVFAQGKRLSCQNKVINFGKNFEADVAVLTFDVPDIIESPDHPGFYELAISSADTRAIFNSKVQRTSYGFYWKPGKKSFVAEVSDKFSDNRVIMQIEKFKTFIQTYCGVVLDRDKDYGESVSVINPYNKAGLMRIYAHDRGLIKKVRVGRKSAVNVRLADILLDKQDRWMGTIQLSGVNRFPFWTLKHNLSDPSTIIDHEHLDWFQPRRVEIPRASYYFDRLHRRLLSMGKLKKP